MAKGRRSNVGLLSKLVDKLNCSAPSPTCAVAHLRLGDVLELSFADPLQMLREGGDPGVYRRSDKMYLGGIKPVAELARDLYRANLTCVHLIGGSHNRRFGGKLAQKGFVYSHCLASALRYLGFTVTSNYRLNPDEAFCQMSKARFFIASSGGYSRLIAHSVIYRKGVVLGRTFK